MDDIARLPDTVLENTVGRRVRDLRNKMRPRTKAVRGGDAYHERREVVPVLLCLRTEVCNV
jgi:hypothetical protein